MVGLAVDIRKVAREPFAMGRLQPMTIEIVDPTSDPTWDTRILELPGCSVFHSSGWARVLRESYGYQPRYFVAHMAGCLHAVLPVVEINSWLTGRRGVALPFTDECPPLACDSAAGELVLEQAREHGRMRGWRYLELRGGEAGVPASATGTETFFCHQISLDGDESGLFARTDPAVRRAVRKAEKCGVSVEADTSLSAVWQFYQLHCRTRLRHGLPPQPFRFFAQIQQQMLQRGLGQVLLAFHDRRPIAGAVLLHLGRRAVYKFAASDVNCQYLRGNNLVLWEALKHYARRGFETLHLGRTAGRDAGLLRFKRAWGAQEYFICYRACGLRPGSGLRLAAAPKYWHTRLFRHLPVIVSRMVGAALYRHIG